MKKVAMKTIILSENAHVVNVKRLACGKCKEIGNVSNAPVAVKNNAVKLIGNVGGNTENSVSKSNEKSEAKISM